jgi:hypothetical protein
MEESYQTPNRIHIKLYSNEKSKDEKSNQNGSFLICDYVFPDETSFDISERIRELFDYEISDTENQIVFVENLPRNF